MYTNSTEKQYNINLYTLPKPEQCTKNVMLVMMNNKTGTKGLGNIVQMRENGAQVVTSMLDVDVKIIWKFEWKRTIINDNNFGKLIWSIL